MLHIYTVLQFRKLDNKIFYFNIDCTHLYSNEQEQTNLVWWISAILSQRRSAPNTSTENGNESDSVQTNQNSTSSINVE